MVKVQNGWETRNINDLETYITSAQTSPVSTAPLLRRPYESPRPGSSSTQPDRSIGGFMQSSERTTATATPDHVTTRPHYHTGTAGLDYAYPQQSSAAQSPPSAESGRTYESFWREHSHSNHQTSRPMTSSSSSATKMTGPSLAPPVDITPRVTARRTNPTSFSQQPPRLETNTSSTNSAAIALTTMPATPPPPNVRQSTAEDIDAIETLMFMSSPKNTAYHLSPQRLSQNQGPMPKTPLRQHLEPSGDWRGSSATVQGTGIAGAGGLRVRSEADIDRMLDEMSDGGSSSDDEEVQEGDSRMSRLRT